MFIQLAIRNVLAYRKRSVITLLLGTVSTALLVFSSAWMDGSHQQMIKNAVEIYSGYIQITGEKFRKSPSFEHLLFDVEKLQKDVEAVAGVEIFSPRFEAFVLYSVGEKAVGGMLTGIDPEKERRISRLYSSLKEGSYLSNTDTNQLYIGNELARRLKLQVGDELAFVGSGADYSFAADKLIVKGIFQTGLFEFDATGAFLAKPYFDMIMAAGNLATHGIVLPHDTQQVDILAKKIGRKIGEEFQAASWMETMAALVKSMKLDSVFGYITLGIIFTVIFFVVMIYTLLAVFARIREIGIMRAVGTTPRQIFGILLLESSILGFISVVAGGLIGAVFAYYFNVHPMVFSGMEEQFKQYGLAVSAMPTAFEPVTILRDMLVMFVLLLLSTLYPIIKANRYQPIEAMHHV
ncbi:MAG: FtsX-like permease family protein [Thermodesulfobacteriota bacterium]|nr:FtsX-like permease family protein [Thermodesulfobacteriota bacterium]